MRLQPGIQLRQGTRAVIRPKTLLGEKYVELVRPQSTNEAFLGSGATIDRTLTAQAVEIDDIFNAMDAPDPQGDVRIVPRAWRRRRSTPAGHQPVAEALDATLANLRPLARVGENRQKELDRILTNLNTIMQALADEQDQLGKMVDSGDTVMSGIAARDQALAGTVQNGAAVFSSLDQAFNGVTAADRASLAKSPGDDRGRP